MGNTKNTSSNTSSTLDLNKIELERAQRTISQIKEDIRQIKKDEEIISRNIFHDRDILDDVEDINLRIQKATEAIAKAEKERQKAIKKGDKVKELQAEVTRQEWLKRLESERLNIKKKEIELTRTGYNKLDRFEKDFSNQTALIKKSFKEIGDGIKAIGQGAVKILGPWGKMSQAAANYAKQIGLSGKAMDELRKHTIRLVDKGGFGIKYNTSVEQLMKLQEGFIKNTGRQVMITNGGLENLAATSKILGDNAGQFMGRLENFGLSAEEAGKRAGKMFAEASKKGLAWENYSKSFLDNITLAQRYNFKNGLSGLASMAEKAAQINLNMSQAASFADKVSTVEGAITTGAQLQVLGGPFAQMADPLGMLYEGLNDMEALQDRMIQMFGNLGQFNRKTGEVEISSFNRQRIKAAAQSMGLDASNVFESINSSARRNEIARQLAGNTSIDKDTAELLKNVGIIQNGRAGAVINGKFKDVNSLTNSDAKYLTEIARSESDDVKDIAQRLRGWEDSVQGFQAQKDATHANMVESIGIGKGIQNLVNDVGEMRLLLQTLAAGAMASGLGLMAGGAFKAIKGISHLPQGVANTFGSKAALRSISEVPTPQIGDTFKYKGSIWKVDQTKTGGLKVIEQTGEKRVWSGNAAKQVIEKGNPRSLALKAARKMPKTVAFGAKATGAIAKGANIAGWGGLGASLLGDYLVSSGKVKRGGGWDYGLHTGGGAMSGGALGFSIGALTGPLAPILAPLFAAIGTGVGAWTGARAARRNQVRGKISEQGVELNGNYSVRELKQIRAALNGEGDLSEKLKAKMAKNGDVEVVDRIKEFFKNEVVKVQVVKAQKKATGGIVEGDSKTGDKIPVMTNAGELILNEAQQGVIAKKLTESVSPVVPRPDTNLSVAPAIPVPQKPVRVEFGDMNINFSGDDVNIKGEGGLNTNITKQMQQQLAEAIKQDVIRQIQEGLNRAEHGGRLVPGKGTELVYGR